MCLEDISIFRAQRQNLLLLLAYVLFRSLYVFQNPNATCTGQGKACHTSIHSKAIGPAFCCRLSTEPEADIFCFPPICVPCFMISAVIDIEVNLCTCLKLVMQSHIKYIFQVYFCDGKYFW